MLLTQKQDPSRNKSYNLIKRCKCVEYFWWIVDELLCMVVDAEQMVQVVRDNLRIAQSRQKSYADGKRRDLTFNVDDYVYLKVSPMRGIRRFNVKWKLAPRYIGPFKVLERKGEVAYRLELPTSLSGVHDVFHISQLKKCGRHHALQRDW